MSWTARVRADEEAEMADGPTRFEATILPGAQALSLARVADLDLDRIPDPDGEVRVLITAEDAERLLEQGFEVRLLRAHAVRPLDPALISQDADVQAWLDAQTAGIDRAGGS
jgi:hypothetical protein